MTDMTVQNLITEIQTAIYQSSGASVQVYSEDLIKRKIQDCFVMLAEDPDVNWKRFYSYETRTLDGTSGRCTVPISTVFTNFNDITAVYAAGNDRALAAFDITSNPARSVGTTPLQIAYDATDVMKVVPPTATGDIVIVGRIYPTFPFLLTTVVPFDYLAIKSYVAWQYMTEDGSNPSAAELLRQQFETRYKQLQKMQDRAAPALNGTGGAVYPTEWW